MQPQIGNVRFKITDLSEQMNMSQSTLLRNFKYHIGLTPKQYFRELRLQKAREILRKEPTIPIKRLAQEVGMANQTHFAKDYKKRFGIELINRKTIH